MVRLYPEAGAATVRVRLRGMDVPGAHADHRRGLMATVLALTQPRYSGLQRSLRAELLFTVRPGEPLFLMVAATPTVYQAIVARADASGGIVGGLSDAGLLPDAGYTRFKVEVQA